MVLIRRGVITISMCPTIPTYAHHVKGVFLGFYFRSPTTTSIQLRQCPRLVGLGVGEPNRIAVRRFNVRYLTVPSVTNANKSFASFSSGDAGERAKDADFTCIRNKSGPRRAITSTSPRGDRFRNTSKPLRIKSAA